MYRRSLRKSTNGGKPNNVRSTSKLDEVQCHTETLGSISEKSEEEDVLERLVLGGESAVVESLTRTDNEVKHKSSKRRKFNLEGSFGEVKKPAWEDEETDSRIYFTGEQKWNKVRRGEEKEVTVQQYKERLKNQFEKVSVTPSWAKLSSERDVSSGEDSDVEGLTQSTGNFLVTSESLPKSIIEIKKCTDANKENPSASKLTSVEFHPSAQVILTAGTNNTLNLFQVDGRHNPKIQSVFLDNYPMYTAHFSANGEEVVMGSKHKCFYYYDMIAGKIVNVPQIKGLEENCLKRFEVSPDGKYLVFLGKFGHIHLLSAKSKEWIQSLKMNGSVESIAFSKDGRRMFSHGDDGRVYVWDMSTRDCVHNFVDDGCVKGTSLATSPNGQYLVCGSYSGVVNIYETESCLASRYPKPLKAIMNLTTSCTKALFNSHSEILAIASNYTEKGVKLVHFPSLTVFSNFPDRKDSIFRIPVSLDFSTHSGYFCVGTHKGNALLYRLKHYGNY